MSRYSAIEKQQIMLYSDLLDNPLSIKELSLLQEVSGNQLLDENQLDKLSVPKNLKNKVLYLLSQGVKLGFEIGKLEQRGIQILFLDQLVDSNSVLEQFSYEPQLFFTIGNERMLTDEIVKIVKTAKEAISSQDPVILIGDTNFENLLRNRNISKKIADGQIVIISDRYREKANLKKEIKSNKKVFISGSRTQEVIPENVQRSLELIKQQQIKILIGDSEKGVDNEIIDYLRLAPKYSEVEIYSIKAKARVKVEEEWKLKIIETEKSLNPQEKQMEKDRVMADQADWGLAVFNPITKNRYGAIQVSAGTLRNTIQMLLNKKAVKFFYVYETKVEVANLKNISELRQVIETFQDERLVLEEKEIILSAKGVKQTDNISMIKYQKIMQKFLELLKKEEKIISNYCLKQDEVEIDQTKLF